MTLITGDELARGVALVVFGGAAGAATIAWPGSALWVLPASLGVLAGAATVPEIRIEARRAWPQIAAALPKGTLPAPRPPVVPKATPPQRHASAATPDSTALPPRAWLHTLNDEPDRAPHVLITGPSGSGKTTLATATLSKRPGRVVVLSPKVVAGGWAGAEVVSLDDDLSYAPLATAIDDLQMEARQRAVALRSGAQPEPLTIVLDELPELAAEIPAAGPFVVRLSRWGRELGMRQMIIATSDEALNIKGWAATRANYVRVGLDRLADNGSRSVWLDDGRGPQQIDLGNAHAGAQRARLRPWRTAPSSAAAPAEDDLLASLLNEVPSAPQRQGTPQVPVPLGTGTRKGTGTGNLTINVTTVTPPAPRRGQRQPVDPALVAQYRRAGAAGRAFKPLFAELGGSKDVVFPAWQEGRRAPQKSLHEG